MLSGIRIAISDWKYMIWNAFSDNAYESNQEFAFGLLFKLSDHSDLNFTFNYVDQELGGHRLRGVPVDDNGNFILPISFNTNEPTDFQNMDAKVLQSILNHSFNDSLRMRTGIRYLTNKRYQQYHENRDFVNETEIQREFRDQYRANE